MGKDELHRAEKGSFMKILILSHFSFDDSPHCGFVHEQALALRALGHEVRVISPVVRLKKNVNQYAYKKRENIVDGIPMYYPRYWSFSNYGRYGLNVFSAFYPVRRVLSRMLADFRPDVIHAHTFAFDGALGARLKEAFGIPLVITTHGTDTVYEVQHGKGRFLAELAERADHVVCVSKQLEDMLLGCDPHMKTSVIYNGFRGDYLTDAEKSPCSVISVGHLIPLKKFDVTIRAFAEVKKRFPAASLTIVGYGVLRESLEAYCAELGVADCVKFTGPLSNREVLALMARHEVYCMPSENEGFGIVYLEAMASGCVTIATKNGGIRDILHSEENGILTDPDDVENIAAHLERIFTDEGYKEKLRENGKRTALHYTWEENARQNLALYETLTGKSADIREDRK